MEPWRYVAQMLGGGEEREASDVPGYNLLLLKTTLSGDQDAEERQQEAAPGGEANFLQDDPRSNQ